MELTKYFTYKGRKRKLKYFIINWYIFSSILKRILSLFFSVFENIFGLCCKPFFEYLFQFENFSIFYKTVNNIN